MKYICPCGYEYDPAVGDPDNGVAPGTPWEELPEDWTCPICGVSKEDFNPIGQFAVTGGRTYLRFRLPSFLLIFARAGNSALFMSIWAVSPRITPIFAHFAYIYKYRYKSFFKKY